jgi:hypothetical protein
MDPKLYTINELKPLADDLCYILAFVKVDGPVYKISNRKLALKFGFKILDDSEIEQQSF